MPEVKALHVTESKISEFVKSEDLWSGVKDASGISKMHVLACSDGSRLGMYQTDSDIKPSSTFCVAGEKE